MCSLILHNSSTPFYINKYSAYPLFFGAEIYAGWMNALIRMERTVWNKINYQYIGFLDDLFVEPEFRGQKIAQKLISHLKSLSKANNWNGIRWITHSSNENAKKLYDKIANNTGFELYELKGD